eukprot:UN32339
MNLNKDCFISDALETCIASRVFSTTCLPCNLTSILLILIDINYISNTCRNIPSRDRFFMALFGEMIGAIIITIITLSISIPVHFFGATLVFWCGLYRQYWLSNIFGDLGLECIQRDENIDTKLKMELEEWFISLRWLRRFAYQFNLMYCMLF